MIVRKRITSSYQRSSAAVAPGGRRKRPWWEYLFVIGFLASIILFVFVINRHEMTTIRKQRLRNQLWQIRNAIIMYQAIRGEMPPDLGTLVEARIIDPKNRNAYRLLENMKVDDGGRVIDPFDNPYVYDSSSGRVFSTDACCRNW